MFIALQSVFFSCKYRKTPAFTGKKSFIALGWWDSLDVFQTDKENWATIKANFLLSFEPKHLAKTICANLQDLTQKIGEGFFLSMDIHMGYV